MKHNKICSSPHKAHIFHHSITYTVKSVPSRSRPCSAESENITFGYEVCLNKGPVFSAEEELGQP